MRYAIKGPNEEYLKKLNLAYHKLMVATDAFTMVKDAGEFYTDRYIAAAKEEREAKREYDKLAKEIIAFLKQTK